MTHSNHYLIVHMHLLYILLTNKHRGLHSPHNLDGSSLTNKHRGLHSPRNLDGSSLTNKHRGLHSPDDLDGLQAI